MSGLRIDVATIFPAYLDPLRHALLGKAIERGILSVGVHDLRDWATDVHRSVDGPPYGGGPGMVMKPTVWGPALDDISAGTGPAAVADRLDSAQPHVDRPRHDDLAGAGFTGYDTRRDVRAEEDGTAPLLIVPTPAGAPFTQEMARAWSHEDHIVFACGRYEGIDQRVVDDAAHRYRVREVSIGDYVLIGGEVAVLVIAEAIVRLIPGVLGNAASHVDDSFSDGLLEGPSYTKPREWRGLEVPGVLIGGNHAHIDAWRREQSLLCTAARRPELIEKLRLENALSTDDEKILADPTPRAVSTDLNLLITPGEWRKISRKLGRGLERAGYLEATVHAEEISLSCEPENMLVAQFMQAEGHAPTSEVLHRVIVNGVSALDLRAVTKAVIAQLPEDTYWYGTSKEGHTEPGSGAACAWRP